MSCVYKNFESTMALAASVKKDKVATVCNKSTYTPQISPCPCIHRPLRAIITTTMKYNTFSKLNHMITTKGVDLPTYTIVSREPHVLHVCLFYAFGLFPWMIESRMRGIIKPQTTYRVSMEGYLYHNPFRFLLTEKRQCQGTWDHPPGDDVTTV